MSEPNRADRAAGRTSTPTPAEPLPPARVGVAGRRDYPAPARREAVATPTRKPANTTEPAEAEPTKPDAPTVPPAKTPTTPLVATQAQAPRLETTAVRPDDATNAGADPAKPETVEAGGEPVADAQKSNYAEEAAELLAGLSANRKRRKTATGLPAGDPELDEPPITVTRLPRKGQPKPTKD